MIILKKEMKSTFLLKKKAIACSIVNDATARVIHMIIGINRVLKGLPFGQE